MDELELYPITEIKTKQEIEQLGTKEKYWIYCPVDKCKKLFKIGRPNTGEDWAEVAAYCQRAKTPFYDGQSQRLSTLDACRFLGSKHQAQLCYWLDKIGAIDTSDIKSIFIRIPNEFISDQQRLFAQEVLKENMKRLAVLRKEICQNE